MLRKEKAMSIIKAFKSGMSNGYFVVGKRGTILVDTGSEIGQTKVYMLLESAGLRPQDVKLIVITHGHVDHFNNINPFADITGAPILCHVNSRKAIEEGLLPDVDCEGRTTMGREIWAAQQLTGNPICHAPKRKVDIVFNNDEYDLADWGIDGQIIYTPGHSRGCCSVVTDNNAIVGDLFTAPAGTDLVGMAYFCYHNAPYKQAQESIIKLLDLGIQTFWPGHGQPRDAAYVRSILQLEQGGHEMYYTQQELIQAAAEYR